MAFRPSSFNAYYSRRKYSNFSDISHTVNLYASVGCEIVNTKVTASLVHPAHSDVVANPFEDASRARAHDRNHGPSLQSHQIFPHDHDHHPEAAG